jgi:hypothetical protein
MPTDKRDILELLQAELNHIEQGGYGRRVRTPWQPTSIFQDSLTCLNYGLPFRAHSCGECFLNELVPPENRAEEIPCHHIPLDAQGSTIEGIEWDENQQKLEENVKVWLRAKIKEVERAAASNS